MSPPLLSKTLTVWRRAWHAWLLIPIQVRAGTLWLQYRRRFLWTLGLYLALQAFLAMLVPWVVTGPVTRLVAQALNRTVSIERARFNPFTLTLSVHGLRVQDLAPQTTDTNFVTVGAAVVNVSIASVWRMAPVLDALDVQDPHVRLVRHAAGDLNISDWLNRHSSRPPPTEPAAPVRFALRNVSVHGGELHFDDLTQGTHHAIQQIEFSLPYVASFYDAVDTAVTPLLNARLHGGELRLGAQSKPFKASRETTLHLSLQGFDLASAVAGLPALAPWRLHQGRLDVQIQLTLRAADNTQAQASGDLAAVAQAQAQLNDLDLVSPAGDRVRLGQIQVGSDHLTLSLASGVPGLAVEQGHIDLAALRVDEGAGSSVSVAESGNPADATEEGVSLLVLQHLKAHGVLADSRRRTVRLQRVQLDGMEALAHRLASGQWQGQALWSRWPGRNRSEGSDAVEAPAGTAQVNPSSSTSPAPWQVAVDRVSWGQVAARWRDDAATPSVSAGLQAFEGSIEDWSTQVDAEPRFSLKTELMHGGTVALSGQAKVAARQLNTQLDVSGLNLAVVQPYLSQALDLRLSEGKLDTHGQLGLAVPEGSAPQVNFKGAVDIADLYTRESDTGDDFLRWKRLLASDIDVAMRPTAMSSADTIRIGQLALEDLFAKVVIHPNGRLNLQDILRQPTSSSPQGGAAVPAVSRGKTDPTKRPRIQLGGVRVAGGRINFTDHFIKPNYTTNITDLKGSVSAVGPDTPPATVNLRGRVEGDAPITIQGRLNPVAATLVADIAAKARGIDLPVLTPYSAKYAGYPIERGKLTLDVNYKIHQGKLSAQNRIFLDQLTFGEHVDSPSATKLPVLLAISLLKNSRGEIDLKLPISGTLNDPQFSIGAVIRQVLVNLIQRAVTAPFRLLASMFGDDHGDMGMAEFVPGTAVLTPSSSARLVKLAQALNDRPGLKLDVVGRVDPVAELGDIRRLRLNERLWAMRNSRGRADVEADTATLATLRWDEREYAQLLQRVYDKASLPNKPRNMVGLAKKVPVADMESLLMEATPVSEADLQQLAQARAHAAREVLAQAGVPSDRLFTLAPSITPKVPETAVSSAAAKGSEAGSPDTGQACVRACAKFALR